jgi:hypothetical protein
MNKTGTAVPINASVVVRPVRRVRRQGFEDNRHQVSFRSIVERSFKRADRKIEICV